MPISKRRLADYLEHFKVAELKELSKYFNIRVARQNGGYFKKQELIWNLLGGAQNPTDLNLTYNIGTYKHIQITNDKLDGYYLNYNTQYKLLTQYNEGIELKRRYDMYGHSDELIDYLNTLKYPNLTDIFDTLESPSINIQIKEEVVRLPPTFRKKRILKLYVTYDGNIKQNWKDNVLGTALGYLEDGLTVVKINFDTYNRELNKSPIINDTLSESLDFKSSLNGIKSVISTPDSSYYKITSIPYIPVPKISILGFLVIDPTHCNCTLQIIQIGTFLNLSPTYYELQLCGEECA